MKTSELRGVALDWAVAKCEGIEPMVEVWPTCVAIRDQHGTRLMYSQAWVQGGPIIERELIGLAVELDFTRAAWMATIWPDYSKPCTATATGNTPLIAAMRCFVASKMGDEIELPNELAGLEED